VRARPFAVPNASVNIYLLAGQRNSSENNPLNDKRELFKIEWQTRFISENQKYLAGCGVNFDILSYTRLFEENWIK
jgi:hypothetical protein